MRKSTLNTILKNKFPFTERLWCKSTTNRWRAFAIFPPLRWLTDLDTKTSFFARVSTGLGSFLSSLYDANAWGSPSLSSNLNLFSTIEMPVLTCPEQPKRLARWCLLLIMSWRPQTSRGANKTSNKGTHNALRVKIFPLASDSSLIPIVWISWLRAQLDTGQGWDRGQCWNQLRNRRTHALWHIADRSMRLSFKSGSIKLNRL